MHNPEILVILGAGGHAREVLWTVRDTTAGVASVAGFAVTGDVVASKVESLPVVALEDVIAVFGATHYVAGIGSPQVKERLCKAADRLGLQPLTVVHPTARVAPTARIEDGAVVFANSVVSMGALIGRHAHVNFAASISHDSQVGAYALVSPGVRVAGNVIVGERAFIGIGAQISNGTPAQPLRIGPDAVVGAGATVIRDVEAGRIVGGTPARPLRAVSEGQ